MQNEIRFALNFIHNCKKATGKRFWHHYFCQRNFASVLGIETSCDDTGAAVIETSGKLLGDCLSSQARISVM
ncbi:uncharacterized protein DC041_0006593 [Schistosoma bovis]|nr:uncharacterized protein DC041_0006593 [Schistosoma bovis]